MHFSSAQENINGRIQYSINDNWKFSKLGLEFASTITANDSNWGRVELPHIWNATDPFNDDQSYLRGICWYRKKLILDKELMGKRIYLYFEGANQVADIYVNNNYVGQHKGGYTAFNFDITDYVKFNNTENVIAVQVNNATDFNIPPLSVGYAMYGGIYRDSWIIATAPLHFSLDDFGSKGVYISTPEVSKQFASVISKSIIKNKEESTIEFEIVNSLYDASGKLISTIEKALSIAANVTTNFEAKLPQIKYPNLWSPEKPYLYTLVSQVKVKGNIVDELKNKVGFRWFNFNAKTGFSLNGSKYILKGTNRHQDLMGKGSALTNEDHYRDLKIIKDMGCNFLRLAHYPQDPEVLRLADQMGLLIWEEIPVVNNINPAPEFARNAQVMLREMIRQHYNHPSIVLWGSMNEVLLWSKGNERIQKHEDIAYLNSVRKFELLMDSTVRAEDPHRFSTMAMHISDDYETYNLAEVPQVTGWNIYNGWYSGTVDEFGSILDEKHLSHPNEILFISEYGAESDRQINTENPQRLDFSGNYQRYFHESYLAQIKDRPYLAGSAIWNQFDFSQPNIGGTISHLNHKGLVTWDRIKKDSYYLYKANWNPSPMVYIATRDWMDRGGGENELSTIDVYSNLAEVILMVNGTKYPSKKGNNVNKFSWKLKLQNGINIINASGKAGGKILSDQVEINYKLFTTKINEDDFRALAINVGSNTQYLDDTQQLWINDQAYKQGGYGYIGGDFSTLNIKSLITNTDDTPLFYSYLNNLKSYRLDVSAGQYELELCFAEPDKIAAGLRIFDVSINGKTVEKNLDLSNDYGIAVATKKKYIVDTAGPIQIDFSAITGKTVLNGLKITKLQNR